MESYLGLDFRGGAVLVGASRFLRLRSTVKIPSCPASSQYQHWLYPRQFALVCARSQGRVPWDEGSRQKNGQRREVCHFTAAAEVTRADLV